MDLTTVENNDIYDEIKSHIDEQQEPQRECEETDIDYISVLDYLRDNMEIPYSNPQGDNINIQEKNVLLILKIKVNQQLLN
jgi:hypothetical protein